MGLKIEDDLPKVKWAEYATCLAGAEIRRFKEVFWDADNERLTINFSENEGKIDAGVPYIIRWGTPETATGEVINNPSFTNVTITNDLCDNEELDDPDNTYETSDGGLTFEGQIAPVLVTANSRSLLLGAKNKLYKPKYPLYVYATRAYFTYTSGSGISMAREFVMDFGEGEQTTTYIDNITVDENTKGTVLFVYFLKNKTENGSPRGFRFFVSFSLDHGVGSLRGKASKLERY